MAGTPEQSDRYGAALGLAWLSRSGCHGLLHLLREEPPEAVWGTTRRELLSRGIHARAVDGFEAKRASFCRAQAEALMEEAAVWFVPFGSSCYPEELGQLSHPPAGLFVRGSELTLKRLLAVPRVTIVGTRGATAYGARATDAFATAFAARGVGVISGMALGIDGRAHEAAFKAGGLTAAVLGCGPDVVYPPRNRWLYERLVSDGVLLSELPPGTEPARWTFPRRNRLLAALGDAVVVVEAPRASGALQTVTWALDLGRPVFSVPGSIYAEKHVGCNQLLYDGAGAAVDPFVTVEDFLSQTRMERRGRSSSDGRLSPAPASSEHVAEVHLRGADHLRVWQALGSGPSSVDDLLQRTGLRVREVSAALAELELGGLVRRRGPGSYARAP